MKLYLVLLTLLFCTIIENQAQNNYNVNTIPAELKKNARSVIRLDEQNLEIHNAGKAVLKSKYAITILNKNGLDDALFKEYYDKHSRLFIIRATVYDKNGKRIKRIPKGDIHDFSAVSNGSIYDDSRVKFIDPEVKNFPFTVEYEYTNTLKSTLNIPSWSPVKGYEIACEKSIFSLSIPNDITLRYIERNTENKANVNKSSDYTIYKWEATNIPAYRDEQFCEPFNNVVPVVHFTLNDFEIGTTKGSLDNWEEFGKWLYKLNQGRDSLPPELSNKFIELVKDAKSDREKVKLLYEYMQNNTRYVSVQVGIGGYQAFEAETVDRLAYGDCKALSNYMRTILKYVGIESHYTLVNAGLNAEPILKDFPSNQFNHVILCVPNKNDTIWLECTSQTHPFGYLGSFTDDRDVLLVKENGGELVHTPKFNKESNFIHTNTTVNLSSNGVSVADIEREYKGTFYTIGKAFIESDKKDQSKMIYEIIDIPHFTVKSFNFSENINTTPSVFETTSIEVDNYTTSMGSNIMFDLNLMNKIKNTPKSRSKRISDIFIQRSSREIDSITYILPEGFVTSSLPEKISISNEFGNYQSETIIKDGNLIYIRNFDLNQGTYSKDKYEDLISFFEEIVKADQKKIILKGS